MESDEPQLLSVAQTAQLLGVPESEVRRQIAAKSLPVVLVDQRMMVLAPALRRWVVAQGEEHRARSQRGPDYLGWDEPAEATGEPCPNCGAPLVPAPEYRSGRHGAVARCPHSLVYFAQHRGRPMRVTDLERNPVVETPPLT